MASPGRLRATAAVGAELLLDLRRGFSYGRHYSGGLLPDSPGSTTSDLEAYFDAHETGPGITKWRHYFSIYERHFAKFRGREVHIVEIGIGSGGSLGMWKDYFGSGTHVYGVDIKPECRVYEEPGTRIFIGDQSDPAFWERFTEAVPKVDIVIDDGGHKASQQIPTLEALLPHLQPGGVYLCEDIHGRSHPFHAYLFGLSVNLDVSAGGRAEATDLQRSIDGVHIYPFVSIIEKRSEQLREPLFAPRHGTEWQPIPGAPTEV